MPCKPSPQNAHINCAEYLHTNGSMEGQTALKISVTLFSLSSPPSMSSLLIQLLFSSHNTLIPVPRLSLLPFLFCSLILCFPLFPYWCPDVTTRVCADCFACSPIVRTQHTWAYIMHNMTVAVCPPFSGGASITGVCSR